jgi:hypothetical protein
MGGYDPRYIKKLKESSDGSNNSIVLPAPTPIGGHRVVRRTSGGIEYADASEISHINSIIGLTISAIGSGFSGQVITLGDIEESSWNWAPDLPLFLGLNGLLTQVVPDSSNSVFSLMLGKAITAKKIYFQIHEPYILV